MERLVGKPLSLETSAQEELVVCHADHDGVDAPLWHEDVRVCVIEPICPDGHASVCICEARGMQDWGEGGGLTGTGDVWSEMHLGDISQPFVSNCRTEWYPVIHSSIVIGVTGQRGFETGLLLHTFEIAALVLGPTFPQPFVLGEPEQILIFLHCHFCTADCVSLPK